MIMRSEKVPESPSSALHTMYFCGASVCSVVRHLIPAGKPAPPRPRNPETRHLFDDLCRAHRERPLKAAIAPVREIIVERDRIDNPYSRKRQPLLLLQIRDLLSRPKCQSMRSTVEEICRKQ